MDIDGIPMTAVPNTRPRRFYTAYFFLSRRITKTKHRRFDGSHGHRHNTDDCRAKCPSTLLLHDIFLFNSANYENKTPAFRRQS
jgi:hypothetical protein